mmetsp:Transcript_10436/g.14297  ORF Transcript_10436/g.14297 Transcript_10436/m.14297 type:complete len:225 (-) Transcript_10436:306-980(-)
MQWQSNQLVASHFLNVLLIFAQAFLVWEFFLQSNVCAAMDDDCEVSEYEEENEEDSEAAMQTALAESLLENEDDHLLADVDPDDLEEKPSSNPSRRGKCLKCHHFQYTVDSVSNLSKSQRKAVTHKCSGIACTNYLRCPTKWIQKHTSAQKAIQQKKKQQSNKQKEKKTKEKVQAVADTREDMVQRFQQFLESQPEMSQSSKANKELAPKFNALKNVIGSIIKT